MAKEIERKFLLSKSDFEKVTENINSEDVTYIKQFYVSFEPEIRLRLEMDSTLFPIRRTVTVKTNGDIVRNEYVFEIKPIEYDRYEKDKIGLIISKQRFRKKIKWGNHIAEIDYYDDLNLYIIEVEFENEYEAKGFIPLSWFGKEVTDDPRYKNKNIAKNCGIR